MYSLVTFQNLSIAVDKAQLKLKHQREIYLFREMKSSDKFSNIRNEQNWALKNVTEYLYLYFDTDFLVGFILYRLPPNDVRWVTPGFYSCWLRALMKNIATSNSSNKQQQCKEFKNWVLMCHLTGDITYHITLHFQAQTWMMQSFFTSSLQVAVGQHLNRHQHWLIDQIPIAKKMSRDFKFLSLISEYK